MPTRGGDPRVDPAPEEVLTLLKEQASLYTKLESLATHQRSLVTGDDMGPLLSVLADRRKVSEALGEIVSRLAPVRRRWSTYRTRLTSSQRHRADRWLADASERLERVMESDQHDARVLSGRKQAVAEALRTTHASGQAISAYRTSMVGRSRLDCTDEGSE